MISQHQRMPHTIAVWGIIVHMSRSWVRYQLGRVGYWLRPYGMLADRRRWRWQPRQRCMTFAVRGRRHG